MTWSPVASAYKSQQTKKDSDFTAKVRSVVKEIPRGETLSYSEVARLAGSPNAARAVGMIMSRNTDRSIPCHRVIRADGKVGGYNGLHSDHPGASAKQDLLNSEK